MADHKLTKAELLNYCRECTNKYGPSCTIGDIEASREIYLEVPKCAEKYLRHNNRRTNENIRRTDEEWRTITNNTEACATENGAAMTKNGAPIQGSKTIGAKSLDILDQKIIKLASEKNYTRTISRILEVPETTIRRRLNRMEKANLITSYKGVYGTKLFKVSDRVKSPFIYNDTEPVHTPFTAHSMTFKFPILTGTQPKSSQGQKMNNWMSYIFKFPNHTIRTTERNVIVFVNQDLGAGSIDDLNLKYSQLAQSYAYKFAEKHHITLGGISKYREAHFTLEDNPLAQIVAERGQFRTTSGIQFDKSRSSGDLEMGEVTAKAFEFTLNKLPLIAAELQAEIHQIKQAVAKVPAIGEGVDSLTRWVQLDWENQHLKAENQELGNSLNELKQEIEEIKKIIPEMNPDRPTDQGDIMYV